MGQMGSIEHKMKMNRLVSTPHSAETVVVLVPSKLLIELVQFSPLRSPINCLLKVCPTCWVVLDGDDFEPCIRDAQHWLDWSLALDLTAFTGQQQGVAKESEWRSVAC